MHAIPALSEENCSNPDHTNIPKATSGRPSSRKTAFTRRKKKWSESSLPNPCLQKRTQGHSAYGACRTWHPSLPGRLLFMNSWIGDGVVGGT